MHLIYGILCSHEKEGNAAICNIVDELGGLYTMNKPDLER